MQFFNFFDKSDGVNSKIKLIIGFVILILLISVLFRLGITGSYIQFQERPLDTILYGIEGVWASFMHNNFTAIILGTLLGWFVLAPYYASLANERNRNPTWGFFYGAFFGILAGFIYIPYLWIFGKRQE